MDILLTLPGAIILLPLLLLVGVVLLATQGRPVLFRQRRVGAGLRPFDMLKFRTMGTGTGTDEQRLTGIGRWLRATSIDELPQVWNVLKGEMSLVGPRPTLPEYIARMTPEQRRRQLVKPGITCLPNVRGRNRLGWSERFALDVQYVDEQSLRLDVTILLHTLITVSRREGISQQGRATSEEFLGAAGATDRRVDERR
jgi:lipopolysaccharide/colanic/teichoic acid biosynthesis glycosyltransferase